MPFGPYLLLKRLAVGGMAELFLAKEPRASRFVVLKRILPYLAEESEFVDMFLDEARIISQLHHPNVVEVYELGQLEGSIFLSMEWVEGMDVRRLLQREQERGGFMPPGVAAWVVARLCEGLNYAHQRTSDDGKPIGIIHRDVSPQNVMLSFKGDVKLVDFGIAKATAWMSRSRPGVIKGKFLYLAPEQLGAEPIDHRIDLFAVGTLLYELTTGQSPFYRTTSEAVIYAIRMEDPVPPHTLRAGYPMGLSRVIMKCLEKDRDRRFQSGEQIRVALEEFMRAEAPTSRADVVRYVASLYGDDDERTGLWVPPNAQTQVRAPLLPDDEPTRSMPAARGPVPSRPAAPEVTAPMPASARAANPWDDEATAVSMPGLPGPIPKVDPEQPGPRLTEEFERHLAGLPAQAAASEPDLAPVRDSPLRQPLRPPPLPRLAPPVPRAPVEEVGPTNPEARPPSMEPTPPPAPARRARSLGIDQDDFVATVDLGAGYPEPSDTRSAPAPRERPEPSGRRSLIFALVGAAVLLAVLGFVWRWSRAPTPAPPAPRPAPVMTPTTRVQFKLARGTVLLLDGAPVSPSEVRELPRGALPYTLRCTTRGRRVDTPKTFDVPASAALVVLEQACPE